MNHAKQEKYLEPRGESDERIRVMFDSAPLACTFWDAEGNLTDCNREALTLFKVSSKEEFCRRFFEFSPALQADGSFSKDRIMSNFRSTLEKGKMHFNWLHRDSEGEWIPSDVTLVRVSFRDGYRVVGYTRDLRDIQAAEDRRREADERSRELEVETRAAKAATDAKSRFLASMSHEIRTPMNAIIGMSDLMRTDNLDEEQRSFFDDIKKMSRTLLQIINDILDISKIEVGKMEIFPVHFNLHELYDHICSLSRFTAESKDLEFRSSFDPEVPHVIYGDDVRIRQIVTNLINNAVKYTQSGSVEFNVTKVLRNNRECLSFAVRDTGIGIRKEDFGKLFNNFQQLDSKKNRGIIGTGLGLAITKNLLSLMEGDVEFDSEYGKGSVFTAFIPLVPGDPEKVEKKILQSRVMATEGTRILVVDDNKTNLKVALAFLAVHGIRAETAAGGEEALEKIKTKTYDLVFMDHMMPGMDGVETARAIRALSSNGEDRFAKMPIIALSANAVSGAQEQFIAAGMNDFISKPIDALELNMKLAAWLPGMRISHFTEDKNRRPEQEKTAGIAEASGEAEIIDRAEGLKSSMGSESLYGQICRSFSREHRDDGALLRKALETGDFKQARRLAHTLKSSSGLIGAKRLGDIARDMEDALTGLEKGEHKTKFYAENRTGELFGKLDTFQAELHAALGELKVITGIPPAGGHREADAAAPPVGDTAQGETPRLPGKGPGAEEILSLFEKLIPLLRTGNTSCLNYLTELKSLSVPLDGPGQILVQQIESFDFPDALNTVEGIKKEWVQR
ncbi:MAG: response regulator [Treponema sp.]|jgi:signal transduction histidine kinase/CheY-like chemotaxis protein|nr:response regulator [Treponema sp.]